VQPFDQLTTQATTRVIVSVDSLKITVGYILAQLDNQNQRRPAQFGLITWNDRETRYSQVKLELYGLFRTLHAIKIYINGVRNLTVEVDAKYILGMINNPDCHPNAAMNRWITAILMFQFKLVHIPGKSFHGLDRLSRRRRSEEDKDEDGEEAENWVEDLLMCGIWIAAGIGKEKNSKDQEKKKGDGDKLGDVMALTKKMIAVTDKGDIPITEQGRRRDKELKRIERFLENIQIPKNVTHTNQERFIKKASRFFYRGGKLWRREWEGRHQIVLFGGR